LLFLQLLLLLGKSINFCGMFPFLFRVDPEHKQNPPWEAACKQNSTQPTQRCPFPVVSLSFVRPPLLVVPVPAVAPPQLSPQHPLEIFPDTNTTGRCVHETRKRHTEANASSKTNAQQTTRAKKDLVFLDFDRFKELCHFWRSGVTVPACVQNSGE
jgi:hypothetical protein